MRSLYRQCVVLSVLYLLVAGLGAAAYFLHYRPMWMTPEVLDGTPKLLRDPATPVERLRQAALHGHELNVSAFQVIDSAFVLLLIISLGACAVLACVALRLRPHLRGGENNAL